MQIKTKKFAGLYCEKVPALDPPKQALTNHVLRCRMCLSTASTFDTTAFNQPPKFHSVTALSLWHELCLYVCVSDQGARGADRMC